MKAAEFEAKARAFHCLASPAVLTGSGQGLLAGLALAHKDVFALPGRAPGVGATRGTPGSQRTARAIDALRAAGASMVASLSLAEWCCGATGENRTFGRPVNPLDPAAVVGGSSSGSAVAVAAGLCPASLGTDTAGSVRIPAATCGLIGLKPSPSDTLLEGVAPLAPSLDTVGVLARSPAEAARLWAVLAAPDDAARAALQAQDIDSGLATVRNWSVAADLQRGRISHEVYEILDDALRRLGSLGTVVMRPHPDLDRLNACCRVMLHVEAAATHKALLSGGELNTLAPATKAVLLPGVAVPAAWYAGAALSRSHERDRFLSRQLHAADVFVTPALEQPLPDWEALHPSSAARADLLSALSRQFPFVNYLGLPAIVFPIGTDGRGRPVSLQAVGHEGSETQLLAFAHQAMHSLLGRRAYLH
jgi:Asp-tRNA(Asn)/Glu-tRNA(Gln) amidotransferase A subunit family amidase